MGTRPEVVPRLQVAVLAPPWTWLVRIVVLVAIAAAYSALVINTARGWPQGYWPLVVMMSNAFVATGYVVVGWLLTERRPTNLVGPLLLAFGLLWASAAPLDLYLSQLFDPVNPVAQADLPLAKHAVLYVMVVGYPLAVLAALALVLFPNGRPLSRRWLLVALVGCSLVLLGVAAWAFGSATFGPLYRSVDSPFRIPGFPRRTLLSISDVASQAMSLFGVIALAARWYRGGRLERAQVKWVMVAVFTIFATGLIAEQFDDGPYDWPIIISGAVSGASAVLLPIAIGIAIMRYRLYDIDRIVSRTVAYASVTGILLAVFLVANLVGLTLLAPLIDNGGGSISVAAATLLVAALFQPLRRRAQAIVDRRFHRSHYDAQRVVEGFAGRLREQVDIGLLSDELQLATVRAVEPAATALWLRPSRPARGGASASSAR